MSSSYKPALLKALARIARETKTQRVELLHIGEHFVQLYWVQTVVFRLRQSAMLAKEPEVVQAIRSTASSHKARRLDDLPREARRHLALKMARVLKVNVLKAFHSSAPMDMPPLFDWNGGDAVHIDSDGLAFLRHESGPIEMLANLWWARYLERVNLLAPRVIEKVERNGAERSSLARYLAILRSVDEPTCFYCGALLADVRVHVDHVIPWSFILSDPLWDLVLSCSRCNLGKSDMLPDRQFLEKLVRVHERRLGRKKEIVGLGLPAAELAQYYDAALSVEWPTGWSPA